MSEESINTIIKSLHPIERDCLQVFQQKKLEILTAHEIDEFSETLDLNKANRGIDWLKKKKCSRS